MKFSFFFLSLCLLLSCSSPQKYMEQGSYEKAFEQSLKKLKSGKIKSSDLQTLEQSFAFLNNRDQKAITELRNRNQPEDWPIVFEKTLIIKDRQQALAPVAMRLKDMGESPSLPIIPINDLLEESRKKSSIYYFARAQEFLPPARSGDRDAARKAYDWLEKCQNYVSNYQGTDALAEEMRDLGTSHVQINPILDSWDPTLTEDLFEKLLWNKKFPFREDWQVYHLHKREDQEMHYRLDLSFSDLRSTGNEAYTDACFNNVEIENGYREERQWSTQDSAWVDVSVPIYITISTTINTFEQYKAVELELDYQLIDLATERRVQQLRFREITEWQNIYSTWSGDQRALNGPCDNFGGYWIAFPLEEDLFLETIDKIRWPFFEELE